MCVFVHAQEKTQHEHSLNYLCAGKTLSMKHKLRVSDIVLEFLTLRFQCFALHFLFADFEHASVSEGESSDLDEGYGLHKVLQVALQYSFSIVP